MKRLKQSEQILMPAIQPPTQPMIIIIADPTAQSLPFPNSDISDIARYQRNPQPCDTYPRENRLRALMRQEKQLLQNTFNEFGAATRSFIGTLVSWVIWRILLPLTVLSVMWMGLASPAELPI